MNNSLRLYDKEKLIEMGLIIESEDAFDSEDGPMPDEQQEEISASTNEDLESEFPNANYELQNEIIRFFSNNPGADPEIFRQYASSIGVEPDELQKQMNILFSQLLKVYLNDAESMGYGDALTNDEDDVPEDIAKLIGSQEEE